MAKNRQNKEGELIKYYVSRSGKEGDCIIEIPAHWRVTFGYVNPSSSGDAYRRNEGHCLRLYEGEKLRTVMGDVTGIRDLSIPLARKYEKESGQSSWSRDSEGNFQEENQRALEAKFVPEDEVEDGLFG